MKTTHGRVRTWLITAAAVTGIAVGAAGVAGAAVRRLARREHHPGGFERRARTRRP